jgi:hypothetical protein
MNNKKNCSAKGRKFAPHEGLIKAENKTYFKITKQERKKDNVVFYVHQPFIVLL